MLQPAEVTHGSSASNVTQSCGPKAPMAETLPVVVLLQRAPLVPELPDTLLALSELLHQPPLLPTPLAQLCFSLSCPGAGSQERLLHSCELWGQSM